MASNVPKKKKKNKEKINYSKVAELLKGKVSFPIDLRKTDKNPSIPKGKDTFSPAFKGTLRKAYNEYKEFNSTVNFIPIKRKAKESKSAYNERLISTKKEMGQAHSHFPGIWIDTPNFAKVSTKRVKGKNGKWRTEILTETKGRRQQFDVGFGNLTRKEKFIPVDPIAYSLDPPSEMKKLYNELLIFIEEIKKTLKKGQSIDEKYHITPVHSGHRTEGSGADPESFEAFERRLTKWSFKYKEIESKKDHWLTGFILYVYVIIPEKGSMGKPVIFDKPKTKSNPKRGR